ncbi:hypothetical protein HZ326_23886 [Fusarium oxysporum f. sp. albedinis]|nr:hypothetical protein HZ326_23886 [Fusarium oxysporum f. sp. albedinis]
METLVVHHATQERQQPRPQFRLCVFIEIKYRHDDIKIFAYKKTRRRANITLPRLMNLVPALLDLRSRFKVSLHL